MQLHVPIRQKQGWVRPSTNMHIWDQVSRPARSDVNVGEGWVRSTKDAYVAVFPLLKQGATCTVELIEHSRDKQHSHASRSAVQTETNYS